MAPFLWWDWVLRVRGDVCGDRDRYQWEGSCEEWEVSFLGRVTIVVGVFYIGRVPLE